MASSKGFTRPLQAWTTVSGSGTGTGNREIVLPVGGWLDVGDYEHLFVSIEASKMYADTGTISLIIESSHTLPGFPGSGAWFEPVGTVTAVTTAPVPFHASRERANSTSATTFTKYLRWRISAPTATVWTATFKVCVNVQ
jgi:hypothetical protein